MQCAEAASSSRIEQVVQLAQVVLLTDADDSKQATMKRAYQDLRSVPLDQRATVLNSARYQSQFSPDERGILFNLLRAEPYEPPQ